ncbi:MAG: PAS domain-containing sensor histidine kinase [Zetaproteobacteria bacterium CG02_land_8_20_14_3_00_50_9]|nr:MAG: PAS domain-containing sensor histidine kinase [Zetaproteobacteria bacterium CG02_land_8_20_14_3_00_50_9]
MNIITWNQFAAHISGYDRTELARQAWCHLFTGSEGQDSIDKIIQSVLAGHEATHIELSMTAKDGNIIDIMLNAYPRHNSHGKVTGVISVGQDITALNISKAQTIQASKLATLGEMSTSMAHELNQPLNVMRMALGNCRRKLEKGNTDLEYYLSKVDRVDSQITRMASIVDHMRMFGRKASESFEPLDLREIIEGAFSLMSETLRLAGIEVIRDICADPLPVMGHRIQVEQVLLNLISNAKDAMNSRINLQQKTLHISVECDDTQVIIRLEDNGGGLPEDKINRIFEPFFTTKEAGHGTGLGLSISYVIIKDMHGTITAENTAAGARFTITLPTVQAEPVSTDISDANKTDANKADANKADSGVEHGR